MTVKISTSARLGEEKTAQWGREASQRLEIRNWKLASLVSYFPFSIFQFRISSFQFQIPSYVFRFDWWFSAPHLPGTIKLPWRPVASFFIGLIM
jgi:hypothetical protein